MAYFRVCRFCGAHLDPGEDCDCRKAAAAAEQTKEAERDPAPREKRT